MKKILFVIMIYFTALPAYAQETSAEIQIFSPQSELRQIYIAEVADTEPKITKGLMWRKQMPQQNGMWFDMTNTAPEQPIAFWMKNTLIPLDILFIDDNLTIIDIKENAKPLDTTPIWPRFRPSYVLEINGGEAKSHNIKIGDIIRKKITK